MPKKTKKSNKPTPEQLAEIMYNSPIVKKAQRAQLAASVYPATQINYAENCEQRRVAEALRIADRILLYA